MMRSLLLFIIIPFLFLSNESLAQLPISKKQTFNATQQVFIKNHQTDAAVYFVKEKQILIAFTESDLALLTKQKTYQFELTTYAESNLKFEVKNKKGELVGHALLNDDEDYDVDVDVYFEQQQLINELGFKQIHFSSKNKINKE